MVRQEEQGGHRIPLPPSLSRPFTLLLLLPPPQSLSTFFLFRFRLTLTVGLSFRIRELFNPTDEKLSEYITVASNHQKPYDKKAII